MTWQITLFTLLVLAVSAAGAANAADSARHIERSGGFTLAAPMSKAFPLFEPIPEKQWAEGWEPTPVYPANGETVEGMVFTSSHTHEPDIVWTLVHYDPASHEITYVNVMPGVRLGRIDIRCSETSEGTRVNVRYSFTALSAGNEFMDKFTQDHFDAYMQSWQHAISYFLTNGRRLQHHGQ